MPGIIPCRDAQGATGDHRSALDLSQGEAVLFGIGNSTADTEFLCLSSSHCHQEVILIRIGLNDNILLGVNVGAIFNDSLCRGVIADLVVGPTQGCFAARTIEF